ncbi:Os01g0541700 [Oryza sativa Japonica Group]|uniref:Os01g0541700 protein n=1 Tax=Oryza sativa subsp. japonica TaxID=39947 RepID=C7IX52_ORYSJ|nr:Os01g0541700 [Oryza sativa Japonica Group]|eukprot:NP_001172400.1 Os01g0541700 [Oryza sativa Japonica Group]
MGRQRGGRRQRRATPAANEPPSKAMGHAAVTKADTGGTSRSARQTVLLHLKPEPKLICQTRWPR